MTTYFEKHILYKTKLHISEVEPDLGFGRTMCKACHIDFELLCVFDDSFLKWNGELKKEVWERLFLLFICSWSSSIVCSVQELEMCLSPTVLLFKRTFSVDTVISLLIPWGVSRVLL